MKDKTYIEHNTKTFYCMQNIETFHQHYQLRYHEILERFNSYVVKGTAVMQPVCANRLRVPKFLQTGWK